MKRYTGIAFSLLLLIQNALSQGTWQRIEVPTTRNLRAVSFPDSLHGWAAGDSGTILHTIDGGITWMVQESHTVNDIMAVFFLDQTRGWASAFNYSAPPYGTTLLKTTDGGEHWETSLYPAVNIFITCIHYFDSLHGWMGGKPHALVETTDGGITWTQATIDTSTLAFFPVLKLAFLNEQVGYACGGMFDIAGVIWRTDNGGALWHAIDPSQAPADEVHAIHIFDEQHAMGSGGDPDYGFGVGMIRTSDGGMNWDYQEIGFQGIAFDLGFPTYREVWAPLGPLKKLIFSLDSGNTWTEVGSPDSTALFALAFPDSLHGCAVGDNGAILRYIPPVIPGVPPGPGSAVDGVTCRVIPNPVVQGSRFKVQSSRSGHFTLTIYSFGAGEAAKLLDRECSPGEFFVDFNGSDLPPGMYLYRLLLDGEVVVTDKFVIL